MTECLSRGDLSFKEYFLRDTYFGRGSITVPTADLLICCFGFNETSKSKSAVNSDISKATESKLAKQ